MKDWIKRVLFFVAGFCTTMAASLSAMDGGNVITPAHVGMIPIVCWLLAIGSGTLAAVNSTTNGGTKDAAPSSA